MMKTEKHPLAEVFGFPIENISAEAKRYRKSKLCPFNNKVPSCTKDKANSPLGVCSIVHDKHSVITCPIRFRQDWLIAEDAANFFFPEGTSWTSLTEIRLADKNGNSAGNIDFVLVSYDDKGKIIDFGSLEIQAVYISGNIRAPFEKYLKKPSVDFIWDIAYNYPKPDYLSSSRKRLVPQVLYKGGIFKFWKKKQAIAIQKSFFDTLPSMPTVDRKNGDIAWYIYDLHKNKNTNRYNLELKETLYTEFETAMQKISKPEAGQMDNFVDILQEKLDEKLENNPPDAPSLGDILQS